jgi:hypothetical protein
MSTFPSKCKSEPQPVIARAFNALTLKLRSHLNSSSRWWTPAHRWGRAAEGGPDRLARFVAGVNRMTELPLEAGALYASPPVSRSIFTPSIIFSPRLGFIRVSVCPVAIGVVLFGCVAAESVD